MYHQNNIYDTMSNAKSLIFNKLKEINKNRIILFFLHEHMCADTLSQ